MLQNLLLNSAVSLDRCPSQCKQGLANPTGFACFKVLLIDKQKVQVKEISHTELVGQKSWASYKVSRSS